MLEAPDVDSLAWVGLLDVLASVVDHEPGLALVNSGHEHIVNSEGPLLHYHGCSDLPALFVDVRLYDEALGIDCVVLEKIDSLLGHLLDLLFEEIEVHFLLRRDRHADDVASKIFGNEILGSQVEHDRLDISLWSIDFVDSYDSWDVHATSQFNDLYSLLLDTFDRRYDQNDHIRNLGSSCPHILESLVARGVDERYSPS